MSGQPLGREEVARIAIALKELDEYRETPLNDLIEPAIRFLQRCGQALEPEDPNSTVPRKWFSRQEAAKVVTGNPRPKRALDQFNRYLEFLSKTGLYDLWDDESMWNAVQWSLDDVKNLDRVSEGFCNTLKEKFSDWRKIEVSKAQSAKAKKLRKIACVTDPEPLVINPKPGGQKLKPTSQKFKPDGQKLKPTD
jgi:hypothetical protein